MEEKLPIQDTILKHFDEPENQILAEEVNHFRLLSDENEHYFQTTKRIWDAAAATKRLSGINVEKAVYNFRARLEQQTADIIPARSFGWSRVAAAAILILAVGFWIYTEKTTVNYIVKRTHNEVDSVVLSDGTKVMLAANSAFRYPEKFSEDSRPVSLVKGKAFFLVSKDQARPFEVTIGRSIVKVLGTSFNINYSDHNIGLTVKTGKVMFTPNQKSKPSILEAGEGLNYEYVKNTLVKDNNENASAWVTKELRFVDMPLDEVCKQLSEYYGVQIVLHDQKLTVKKFNANFKNTSLDDALTALKETYSIKIKKDGPTIVIMSL